MPTPNTQTSRESFVLEDLYNALMGDIEPELMTDALPLLEQLYAGESEEERADRLERYAEAFEVFEKRSERLFTVWQKNLLAFKKNVLGRMKADATEEDRRTLTEIERFFDQT